MQETMNPQPSQPRYIIRLLDWEIIHSSPKLLSIKQAYGTAPVLVKNLGWSPRVI